MSVVWWTWVLWAFSSPRKGREVVKVGLKRDWIEGCQIRGGRTYFLRLK